MGIYSNYNSSYVDDGSYTPRDLFAECGEASTYEELSLAMIAESEQNYNAIMKAIAINEVNYFAENGQEIIYEAGGISGMFAKIKEFFKKLLEKIRQIIHTFIAKISSGVSSDSSFVQKYQKEFSEKWSKVKSDFEFKGYNFTINLAPQIQRCDIKDYYIDAAKTKGVTFGNGADLDAIKNATAFNAVNSASVDVLKKSIEDLDDRGDDIEEEIRGNVANDWSTSTSTKPISDQPLSASEFSKELYECYRNNESEKEGIEKSKLSVSEIVSSVKDADKYTKAANRLLKAFENGIKDTTKYLDAVEKSLVKGQSSDSLKNMNKDDKTNTSNALSYLLSLVTKINSGMKFTSNCFTQANGIYLQAISDKKSQAKAIMVKVIGQGKKMTNESYNYEGEYEDGSSTNYFNSVVLK